MAPAPLSDQHNYIDLTGDDDEDDGRVTDLTHSPSPSPPYAMQAVPQLIANLSPKTLVCVGQLRVTVHVLSPIPYLLPTTTTHDEWAPVRVHAHKPEKPGGAYTISIKTPQSRAPDGEKLPGEGFGVVEPKVATDLGPLLGKGLIQLDVKIRKGPPNLRRLPLEMLVYTPKGNIVVLSNYLHQRGLLLDHPTPPYELQNLLDKNDHYHNPHKPPPGGHGANPPTPIMKFYRVLGTPRVFVDREAAERELLSAAGSTLLVGNSLKEVEDDDKVGMWQADSVASEAIITELKASIKTGLLVGRSLAAVDEN
ncbi:hypothetical protein B0H13DRAFT_1891305 [Mycena leptocephala]|nr:hypothetical protein B0H13DRAFT_1891305 [Mycena leptocephala]